MQENKRSTLSVPLPPTLSSPIKANDIRLSHDPLDMDTLLVWLRMDTTLPGFVRPVYGDLFPGGGWIDPATKTTLYAGYQCCNVHEVDKQYHEFCYRLMPSNVSFYYKWQSLTDLTGLPDTLTGVSVFYNYNSGAGSSSHPASQQLATATGSHGNVTANPRASSEASAAIIPEIVPVITTVNGRNLEMTNMSFEISKGASLNDILLRATSILGIASQSVTVTAANPGVVTLNNNKLNVGDPVFFGGTATPAPLVAGTVYYVSVAATNSFSVSATKGGASITTSTTGTAVTVTRMVRPMPIWKPKIVVMSALGQNGSVSADAETNAGVNWSDDFANYGAYFDYGGGSSYKFGVSNRTMVIPPTLHGTITNTPNSQNVSITAEAEASTNAFTGTPGTLITAITNDTGAVGLTVTGAFYPATINPTTPSAVPTDGFYLAELNPQIHPDQLLLVHCGVVDFSQLA